MSQTVELNGKELKQIATRNDTAKAITRSLADRERIRTESDVIRTRARLIREGAKVVDSDYMQYWKDLEKAGVGSIIYGRKGKPNRFSWHYSLKEISKAMVDGSNPRVHRTSHASPKTQEIETPVRPGVEALAQKVTFFLSPTRMVELRMPDNFSMDEAENVSTALKTLAQKGA